MVGDVVVGLKPNPLLPFCEESVVAGLSFAILHYYGETGERRSRVPHLPFGTSQDKTTAADRLAPLMPGSRVLTVLVAFGQCLQVIYVVVVIS